jgi:hypothetical protein
MAVPVARIGIGPPAISVTKQGAHLVAAHKLRTILPDVTVTQAGGASSALRATPTVH